MGESVDIVVSQTGAEATAASITNLGTAADAAAAKVTGLGTSTDFLKQAIGNSNSAIAEVSDQSRKASTVLAQMQANTKQVADTTADAAVQTSLFSQALGVLGGAIALLGVGALVHEYQQLADAFTGIVSRLKLVSNSGAELVDIEQKLFEVSQTTRVSFEETATLYNRLAQQSGAIGVSQKDLIPVIKTLNEIISLSGVSSAQAARGMLQLSEGLGAGALQGQHLKSLLNDIPTLGLELSKGLGVSIAGLREMASKGELTAKTVIEAFQKVAPEVQKQFGSLAPTISQAFTVLKNSVLQFVGVFDQVNGTSRVVSGAIIFLANNLSTLVRIIETAIITVAAFYAGLAIQTGLAAFSAGLAAAIVRLDAYMVAAAAAGVETTILGRAMVAFQTPLAIVTVGFRALWAAIEANPITAFITVVGAAIALIYAFGDSIFLTSDKSISLLGAMVGAWNYFWGLLKSFVSWMYSFLAPVFTFIGNVATTVFKIIGDIIGGVLDFLGKFIPSLAGASASLAGFTSGLVQSMKDATKSTAEATLANKDFSDVTTKDLESVGNDAKKMAAVAVPEYKKMATAAKDAGKAATDMSLETRDALGNVEKYLSETDKQSGRLYNNIQKGAEDTTASLEKMSSAVTSAAQAQATANGSTTLGSGGQSTNPMLEGGTSTDGGQTFHSAADDIKEFKNFGHPLGNAVSLGTAVPWLQLLDEVGNDAVLKAAVTAAAHGRRIPGFAGGGEFMVGGAGGTDSQLVSFMASPDETVSIQTPKQRSARSGGGGKNVTVNMHVSTPDANSFRRSQNQTFLQLQAKLNTAVNRW